MKHPQFYYLSSFIFPLCVLSFLLSGPQSIINAWLWTIPLWTLVFIDWKSPKVMPGEVKSSLPSWYYDGILYGLSAIQLLNIVLLVWVASQLKWYSSFDVITSMNHLFVMRILVGTSSGSSAIIVAHEFIHRNNALQRGVGHLLLYTVCYDHFVIAHLRSHHLSVATPEDMTTARMGESFNHYWKRVTAGHFKNAWQHEMERLGISGKSLLNKRQIQNRVLQGLVIETLWVLSIFLLFGLAAALIFMYQALAAVRLLETINYYQHWGLEQGQHNNVLAWVNQSRFTEYALIGLSNHISHHQKALTPYYQTVYSDQGPQMPYGYFVSNLWVKLNNASYRRRCEKILRNGYSVQPRKIS